MREMRKLSIVWGVILVLIFAALTVFGILWKNKEGVYKEAEDEIADAAKKYVDAATMDSSTRKVTLKELIDANAIDELKVKDEVCDGYVEIVKDGYVYEYIGYVKCENYTTKGY